MSRRSLEQELAVGAPVTDGVWVGSTAAVATSAGTVKIFDSSAEVSSFSVHAGPVTALAVHPSGDILASVGMDKTYVFYDLSTSTKALQISTNSGMNFIREGTIGY